MTTQKELKAALDLARMNERMADESYRAFESQIADLREKQKVAQMEYVEAHRATEKAELAVRRAKPLSPQQKEVIDLLKAGKVIRYWDGYGDKSYEIVDTDRFHFTKLNRRVLDTLCDNGHLVRIHRKDENGRTIMFSYDVKLAES